MTAMAADDWRYRISAVAASGCEADSGIAAANVVTLCRSAGSGPSSSTPGAEISSPICCLALLYPFHHGDAESECDAHLVAACYLELRHQLLDHALQRDRREPFDLRRAGIGGYDERNDGKCSFHRTSSLADTLLHR